MGITIHYNGKLKQDASLSDMINEVHADIFSSPGWSCYVFEETFEDIDDPESPGIAGMVFSTKKCETVYLTFDRNRNLVTPYDQNGIIPVFPDEETSKRIVHTKGAFTKTQFAGPDVHMRIVDLLRNLSAKYFEKFEMIDEAGYWENPDKDALMERFGFGERIVAMLEEKLKAL